MESGRAVVLAAGIGCGVGVEVGVEVGGIVVAANALLDAATRNIGNTSEKM